MLQPVAPQTSINYRGRFAPSPTGPLHFGSLIAAVASYAQAKFCHGEWFVRIENIDVPRCSMAHADTILRTLELFALNWDGEVVYQQSRTAIYDDYLSILQSKQLTYPCRCSRKQLQPYAYYPGNCRNTPADPSLSNAIRLKADDTPDQFLDVICGPQIINPEFANDDYIIKRRDGLFSYQFVVVVDDIEQKITEVIRGEDLLECTTRQQNLFSLLGHPAPRYGHFPIARNADGHKLSKQSYAPALEAKNSRLQLFNAMCFLNQSPPAELTNESCETQLQWLVPHWNSQSLRHSLSPKPTT